MSFFHFQGQWQKVMLSALTFLFCLFSFWGVIVMSAKANGAEMGSGSSCYYVM